MIEITSTPLIIIAILGVAGVVLPVINVIRKEKGSGFGKPSKSNACDFT